MGPWTARCLPVVARTGGLSEFVDDRVTGRVFEPGGVESLANHPAVMTHASIPEDRRNALGVTGNLVRLSVGVEDAIDLWSDIQQALSA